MSEEHSTEAQILACRHHANELHREAMSRINSIIDTVNEDLQRHKCYMLHREVLMNKKIRCQSIAIWLIAFSGICLGIAHVI